MSDYTVTLKRVCDVYGKNEVLNWFKDYSNCVNWFCKR